MASIENPRTLTIHANKIGPDCPRCGMPTCEATETDSATGTQLKLKLFACNQCQKVYRMEGDGD